MKYASHKILEWFHHHIVAMILFEQILNLILQWNTIFVAAADGKYEIYSHVILYTLVHHFLINTTTMTGEAPHLA